MPARSQVLIVIDQLDDHATRWKDQLIDDDLVINQKKLRKKNHDCSKLGLGVLGNRLGVLFVCRDDMQWALAQQSDGGRRPAGRLPVTAAVRSCRSRTVPPRRR